MLQPTDKPLAEYGSLPLRDGVSSLTITGEPASTVLLGSLTFGQLPVSEGLSLRRTTGRTALGHDGIVFDFQRIAPVETVMRCRWLVAGDAVDGGDYDRATLIALWDVTNRQDTHLREVAHSGACCRGITPPVPTAPSASRASATSGAATCDDARGGRRIRWRGLSMT